MSKTRGELAKQKSYSYDDFLEIIRILREKDGCPWDREQTHASLKPCMMEEAAEVVAAIRIFDKTGNYENLREELGDVMLQVVMHAQIAGEEGLFSMEDVVSEVAEKMVRRHPHIFGSVEADTSEKVLENWEDIKKKEKEGKSYIESPQRFGKRWTSCMSPCRIMLPRWKRSAKQRTGWRNLPRRRMIRKWQSWWETP